MKDKAKKPPKKAAGIKTWSLNRLDKGKVKILCSLLLIIITSVSCVLVAIAQPNTSLKVGDTVSEDIAAPRDVYDEEATVTLRLQASSSVEKVYKIDEEIYTSLSNAVISFFDGLDRIRADAEVLRRQKVAAALPESALAQMGEGQLTPDQWSMIVSTVELEAMRPAALEALDQDNLYGVLSISETDMSAWMREAQLRINSIHRRGIKDSNLQDTRTEFRQDLEPLTPLAIKEICSIMAREFISPTLIYSETDTLMAMDEAAGAVEDQYIEKGDILVTAGTVITEEIYEELVNVGVIRVGGVRFILKVLVVFAIILLLACIVLLVAVYIPRYLSDTSKLLLAAILISLTTVIALFTLRVDEALNPIFLAAYLITMLVSGRVAAIACIFMAVVFGMMAMGATYDYGMMARVILTTALGGMAGILLVRKATKRSAVFAGAAVASVVMCVAIALFSVLDAEANYEILKDVGKIVVINLASAILGIGLMPFWEWLFRLATPQRLAELSSANNPLLRRLMLEAPGTYHHSMLVSSLAEAAATAIGANSLLARVGAFYHDVGKLKRPMYFTENQKGENPHDALEPERSAAVLVAHVTDGVLMLQKERMPNEVIRIAQEHHGTSLTSFFYYNAVKQTGDPNLSKAPFRYPGPKPETKESAIVCICDGCEAAVHSMNDPTMEQIEEMVTKIIRSKIEEGQLSRAPITMADLGKIKASILATFRGITHARIEYPDMDDKKKQEKN